MIIYKKLWKLLIDKEIKKTQLSEMANVSMTSIAKLGRNENVNVYSNFKGNKWLQLGLQLLFFRRKKEF